MNRPVRPMTPIGWRSFWLGMATAVWGLFFPALPQLVNRLIEPGRRFIPLGFSGAMLELALALAAIVVGVLALKKGERSWLSLAAFILAVIIGGFWILFMLGELFMPV